MSKSLQVLLLLSISIALSVGYLCPDKKIKCRSGQSCCDDNKGSYGCCPYPNASCCKDGRHCCPHGTICDTTHQQCKLPPNNPISFNSIQHPQPLIKLEDSISLKKAEKYSFLGGNFIDRIKDRVTCPDNKQTCPGSYICCPALETGYGCCPEKNGVCCKDKIHCCPKGSNCDIQGGHCK